MRKLVDIILVPTFFSAIYIGGFMFWLGISTLTSIELTSAEINGWLIIMKVILAGASIGLFIFGAICWSVAAIILKRFRSKNNTGTPSSESIDETSSLLELSSEEPTVHCDNIIEQASDTSDKTLLIKQLIDFSEVALPLEARNRYSIMDRDQNQKYFAYEMAGNSKWAWLVRTLLVASRPFRLMVIDNDQNPVLSFSKPFRFYFHEIEVFDHEKRIGSVSRKFSPLNKLFYVYDHNGKFICKLRGPLWKPWTFNIIQHGRTYGQIKKSWSETLTEAFTDADLFSISFLMDVKITKRNCF